MAKKDDVDEGSGLSDEEWAAFERQFTKEAAKTADYKEPSARQRELTAKWRKEPPKDTGWRTDGPRAPLASGDRPEPTVLPGGKRRRAWRRNVAWVVLAAVVTGLVIGLPRIFASDKGDRGEVGRGGPSGAVQSPNQTPSAAGPGSTAAPGGVLISVPPLDPSRAAIVDKPWPPITAKDAFPTNVPGSLDDRFHLVSKRASIVCTDLVSDAMAALVKSGSGCQQLAQGLYTDQAGKAQLTVSVLTMKRAEDATLIFSTTRTMGADYQVKSLDPAAGSGLPVIAPSAPGVTDNVMTVRSVVTVNAQYSDGGDHGQSPLAAAADILLGAVADKVAAYETSR